jgi:hypothetical protein
MEYRRVEELVGRIRTGWWIVINDHHRGYKAMPLAPEDRPLVCIWHPTKAGVALMMTTLDFGLKNAPYFFSTFSASLLQQITAWLGEDGFSMYYLDDNGTVCSADRVTPFITEFDEMGERCGFELALAKRQLGRSAKCLGRRLDAESEELSIVPEALFRTLVLLSSTVLLIDGDTFAARELVVDSPGTNIEEVEDGTLTDAQVSMATAYQKW